MECPLCSNDSFIILGKEPWDYKFKCKKCGMTLRPRIMAEQVAKDPKFWKIERKLSRLQNDISSTAFEFSALKGIFSSIDEINRIAESKFLSDSPELQIVRARSSRLTRIKICRQIIEKYGVEAMTDALIAWGNTPILQFLIKDPVVDYSKVGSFLETLVQKESEDEEFDRLFEPQDQANATREIEGEQSTDEERPKKARKIPKGEEAQPTTCSKCGEELNPKWKNCPQCATPTHGASESNKLSCPACGKSLKKGWKRCPYCATNLD